MPVIEYYIDNRFGKKRFYVKDKEQRRLYTLLSKRSTITPEDAIALEGLGIELVEVEAPEGVRK